MVNKKKKKTTTQKSSKKNKKQTPESDGSFISSVKRLLQVLPGSGSQADFKLCGGEAVGVEKVSKG